MEFDYVVVGAGSAGCVMAARLSESGRHQVGLIEAGGEDSNFWIKVPLGFGKLYDDPRYCWQYECEPEAELEDSVQRAPRGRILGGSSTINGMVYLRGQRQDYDHWRDLGNAGWGYEDVLPYFIKAEDNADLSGPYHGKGGPLGVQSNPRHELTDAFIQSAVNAGYSRNEDFNGAIQDGFGCSQITARKGQRCSAAMAYLHPARSRPNLSVLTHAVMQRVVFSGGRAVGVEIRRGDRVEIVKARREVILSCGAFASPQLLQLSGVGPGSLLQQHGIPVVADLPGVGENMQDHFTATLNFACTRNITVNDMMANPLRKLRHGLQYLLFRKGLLATNAQFGTGFIRTDPSLDAPDSRLNIVLFTRSGRPRRGMADQMGLDRQASFGISVYVLHPDSRGSVRIRSTDLMQQPEIRFNLFQSKRDHMTVVRASRIARKIASMAPLSDYVARENLPGTRAQSDDELIAFLRQAGRHNNHAIGTCKMGVDDAAVVDPRLRVRGVEGLRVIDASVMPRIVASNTNAGVIMIGEKGADMVLEDARS